MHLTHLTRIPHWLQRGWPLLCAAIAAWLITAWLTDIRSSEIRGDAVETVRMAVNLAHHGVISGEAVDAPRPTMYREPLPAVTGAIAVLAGDALIGRGAATDDYLSGPRSRLLKYHNVVWKAGTVAATYWVLLFLAGSHGITLAGAVLVGTAQPHVDTVLSEPIAASLLALGSALLTIGCSRRRWFPMLAAGVVFGLLALTKAIFLWVFVGLLLCVPLVERFRRESTPWRFVGVELVLLALGFVAVALPWMARNYAHFGTFSLSERAGLILMYRAVKNRMSSDELRGAFYVWSPPPLSGLMSALTGFGPEDLEAGGPLQRLNHRPSAGFDASDREAERLGQPDAAVSYYRKVRAERVRLRMQFEAAGHPNPFGAADAELRRRALEMLKEQPLRHLAMTVPFLWRGAALVFPVLLLGLATAAWLRRGDLALFVLPAFGLVLAYGLFSHFERRYSAPVVPAAVAVGILLLDVARRLAMVRFAGRAGLAPTSARSA
ncbi:MAG: hypothetical protein DIU56_001955 [Pseudomonadota bacterium]|jgi:hypothetical protein